MATRFRRLDLLSIELCPRTGPTTPAVCDTVSAGGFRFAQSRKESRPFSALLFARKLFCFVHQQLQLSELVRSTYTMEFLTPWKERETNPV